MTIALHPLNESAESKSPQQVEHEIIAVLSQLGLGFVALNIENADKNLLVEHRQQLDEQAEVFEQLEPVWEERFLSARHSRTTRGFVHLPLSLITHGDNVSLAMAPVTARSAAMHLYSRKIFVGYDCNLNSVFASEHKLKKYQMITLQRCTDKLVAWSRSKMAQQQMMLAMHGLTEDLKLIPIAALTPTEKEIFKLLVQGITASEIAEERSVSPETVKSQIKSILHKTGSKHQHQLVAKFADVQWQKLSLRRNVFKLFNMCAKASNRRNNFGVNELNNDLAHKLSYTVLYKKSQY